jgi:hypothetical protein
MRTLTRFIIPASALLAVAALVTALAVSAGAASSLKITNCNTALSKPKSVTLTCGDGNTVLKSLSWSSFGGSTAQAKGTFVTNTCKPNCAAGKNVSYPVTVKATGSVSCKKGVRVYGKLALRFTGRAPGSGVPRNWRLSCPV